MIIHDLRCERCGNIKEDVTMSSVEDLKTALPCSCGGRYQIAYLQFPGIVGTETGAKWFKKGYNVQLGRSFESFDEHQKYVKEKGLVMVGPDEAKRNRDTGHQPEEKIDLSDLRPAMEEAYRETFVEGKRYPLKKLDSDPYVAPD